ncbi:unnamed protein product, partial [Prorocentrum cordatum]
AGSEIDFAFVNLDAFHLFTEGIFTRPSGSLPGPASEAPPAVHWEGPQRDEAGEQSFSGEIFMSGSCGRRAIGVEQGR